MSVYAIMGERTGLVKIGVSENPLQRLAGLQSGSPDLLRLVATCDGGFDLEKQLHDWLSAFRQHGEWFSPGVRTLAVVGAIAMGDIASLEMPDPMLDEQLAADAEERADALEDAALDAMLRDKRARGEWVNPGDRY